MSENKLWEKGIEYIEVNLSVMQCMQETLHAKLLQIMDEYKIPYNRINLEITETAAVVSNDTLKRNMDRLVEKGITFALDDFGSGYSNMAYIFDYSFDMIKLDKSMVWSAMDNEKAQKVLKHTIKMMKDMNLHIVAEGVETEEQANKLTEMGCDYFQGFLYSRPVDAEGFLKVLKDI
jgi:EAL domain-containing protein (putative c-di-GMP-specific phosphodiesterase class I)